MKIKLPYPVSPYGASGRPFHLVRQGGPRTGYFLCSAPGFIMFTSKGAISDEIVFPEQSHVRNGLDPSYCVKCLLRALADARAAGLVAPEWTIHHKPISPKVTIEHLDPDGGSLAYPKVRNCRGTVTCIAQGHPQTVSFTARFEGSFREELMGLWLDEPLRSTPSLLLTETRKRIAKAALARSNADYFASLKR